MRLGMGGGILHTTSSTLSASEDAMLHAKSGIGWLAGVTLAACALAGPARADVSEIRISKQYGLPYLSVAVVEQNQLIEKHAKAMGLADVKVNWVTIGRGGTSTDSLLAGNLDFVTSGVSNMLLICSRTVHTLRTQYT